MQKRIVVPTEQGDCGIRTDRLDRFTHLSANTWYDTEDIGAKTSELLTGPAWTGQRVIELGSMVSPDDIATQFGAVLGRDVKAQAIPRAAWAESLEHMGFPHGQTWAFEDDGEPLFGLDRFRTRQRA